jgi:hypothetical protein
MVLSGRYLFAFEEHGGVADIAGASDWEVQGNLAHKKTSPPRTLQEAYA